jgi:hypothetical protein
MGFYQYKPRKGIPAFRKQGKALIKAIGDMEKAVYRNYIKPFCDKTGYEFSAVNGDWWFNKPGERDHIDEDRLPRWLQELMNWDVEGLAHNGIAAWGARYYAPKPKKRPTKKGGHL